MKKEKDTMKSLAFGAGGGKPAKRFAAPKFAFAPGGRPPDSGGNRTEWKSALSCR